MTRKSRLTVSSKLIYILRGNGSVGPQHLFFALVLVVSQLEGQAHGVLEIWLSPIGGVGEGVSVDNADLNVVPEATDQELHVWLRPDMGETLTAIDLNLVSTNPTVLNFSEVTVH